MFRLLDNRVLDLPRIPPVSQTHMYELLCPDRTPPVARAALCGYTPVSDPNNMESLGGWREHEQKRDECAECWGEARRRWSGST